MTENPNLSTQERSDLLLALTWMQKYVHTEQDWTLYFEWWRDTVIGGNKGRKKKWRIPPVGIETFVKHPAYLNMEKEAYPMILEVCAEATSGQYKEAIFLAGIGSGKSFTSQILACYSVHLLLCMEDPYNYYGLARDKDIACINMGVSATQAKNVVFTGITSMIRNTAFFHNFTPEILKTEIRFPKEQILLVSGNSRETTPLGLNVFCAILDEAAFYLDNENRDVAKDIYDALHSRITSRFGQDGMTIMISSPRYEGDFIMRKIHEAQIMEQELGVENCPIFHVQLPTWRVKSKYQRPEWRAENDVFYFDQQKNKIVDESLVDKEELYTLDETKLHSQFRFWQIPNDFKVDFMSNTEKAKRDFGAVPSLTLEGFFPMPALIDSMHNPAHLSPIMDDGTYEFPIPYRVPHFIHIDLALNKHGKGDFAGFSMVHIDRYIKDEQTGESYPHVYVDLVERIGADESGEIQFSKIRQKIYDLQRFGFWIELVTFDQFQSADSIQILKTKGIKADYLSVDRSIEPYNALKQLIYMERLDVYKYPPLELELKRLELIRGTKVDHPIGGHKDVADSLAGAVYSCLLHNKVAGMFSANVG